jgi:fluoride exporter
VPAIAAGVAPLPWLVSVGVMVQGRGFSGGHGFSGVMVSMGRNSVQIAAGGQVRRFHAITHAFSNGFEMGFAQVLGSVRGASRERMNNVQTWLAVAGGGALGSLARFWVTGTVAAITGPRFPYGTLLINVLGSFVIGVVAGVTLTPARMGMHPDVRIFLMVGICGGFTTFSAFSLQTLELIQTGDMVPAALYIAGSVLLCVLAVWGGWALGRL